MKQFFKDYLDQLWKDSEYPYNTIAVYIQHIVDMGGWYMVVVGGCLFEDDYEPMLTEEQLDKLVDATNFSQYVNAAINYNGRLPTDEEYKKLREEYDNLKV